MSKVKLRAKPWISTPFGLSRDRARSAPPPDGLDGEHRRSHDAGGRRRGGVPKFVRIIPIDVPTAAAARRASRAVAVGPALEFAAVNDDTHPRVRGDAAGADPIVDDLVGRLRSTLSFYASRPGATRSAHVRQRRRRIVRGLAAALARGSTRRRGS